MAYRVELILNAHNVGYFFALFGLCTAPAARAALLPVHLFSALIVGGILCTNGLNPGFDYRIRQAVCKLRVCLCTGAFSRRLSRAVAPRWAKIGNMCVSFHAVSIHTEGSAPRLFAPPPSCGHWDMYYPVL